MSIIAGYQDAPIGGGMRQELRMLHAARHRAQRPRRAAGPGDKTLANISTKPTYRMAMPTAPNTRRN